MAEARRRAWADADAEAERREQDLRRQPMGGIARRRRRTSRPAAIAAAAAAAVIAANEEASDDSSEEYAVDDSGPHYVFPPPPQTRDGRLRDTQRRDGRLNQHSDIVLLDDSDDSDVEDADPLPLPPPPPQPPSSEAQGSQLSPHPNLYDFVVQAWDIVGGLDHPDSELLFNTILVRARSSAIPAPQAVAEVIDIALEVRALYPN